MKNGDRGPGSGIREAQGGWTAGRYWLLLAAFVLVHAALAAALPVSGDEAYYWDCSRHPDWATFDQPPLMMLAPIPFRAVLGETRLAVRGPAILASFLIGAFMLPLLRRLGGGPREAAWAYLALHATPLFFFGAFYASTDVGMMAAYVAATWAAVAITQGEPRGWWGFGVAVGLGFLAKFPAVLVLPALAPALLRRETRADLRTPTPYLAALLSAALTAPVWIWAAAHGFVNVGFQLADRVDVQPFTLRYLLEFAALSALLASPPLVAAMALAWRRAWRRRDAATNAVLLAAASPFAFFGAISLRGSVAPHWGAPGVVLGAAVLALAADRPRRLVRWGAAFGLSLSLAAVALVALAGPALEADWPVVGRARGYVADKLAAAVANEAIVAEIERRVRPGELVTSESYSSVHLYAFLSGGRLPTRLAQVNVGNHGLTALYWYRPEELRGRDFLFVTERGGLEPAMTALFASVREEAPFEVRRDGRVVRTVRFYRCTDLLHPEGAFTRLPPAAGPPPSP